MRTRISYIYCVCVSLSCHLNHKFYTAHKINFNMFTNSNWIFHSLALWQWWVRVEYTNYVDHSLSFRVFAMYVCVCATAANLPTNSQTQFLFQHEFHYIVCVLVFDTKHTVADDMKKNEQNEPMAHSQTPSGKWALARIANNEKKNVETNELKTKLRLNGCRLLNCYDFFALHLAINLNKMAISTSIIHFNCGYFVCVCARVEGCCTASSSFSGDARSTWSFHLWCFADESVVSPMLACAPAHTRRDNTIHTI